ncbi:hypothetical protein [Mesorhizobium caraganae]|uniref:hypothetical protein n=1 Tax=Mesorhizobium caraganae TaxID=483206 RepID=UPI00333DB5A3
MSWFVYKHSADKGYRVVGAADAARRGAEKLFAEWLPYNAVPESAAIVGHQRFADDLWYIIAKPAGTRSIHCLLIDLASYRGLEFSPFSAALGAPCGPKLPYEAVPAPALRWAGALDERLAAADDSYLDLAQRLFLGLSESDRMRDYVSALPVRGVATLSVFSRFELRDGAVLDRARVAALVRPMQRQHEAIGSLSADLATFRRDVEVRFDALAERAVPPPSPTENPALAERAEDLESRVAILETSRPAQATPQSRTVLQTSSSVGLAEWLLGGAFAIMLLLAAGQYFLISGPLAKRLDALTKGAPDITLASLTADASDVAGQLQSLNNSLATMGNVRVDLDALGARVSGLTLGAPQGVSIRALLDQLTGIETRLGKLESLQTNVSTLTTRIDCLEERLDAIGSRDFVFSPECEPKSAPTPQGDR